MMFAVFLLGVMVGYLACIAAIWLVGRGDPVVVIPRWWADNPDRWEWYRQRIADEAAPSDGSSPPRPTGP